MRKLQLQKTIKKAESQYLRMLTAKKMSHARIFFYEAARTALVEAIDLTVGQQDMKQTAWLYRRLKFMEATYTEEGE